MLKPIPADRLPEMIGRPIHLAWATPGCVWILARIEGEAIHLSTPRSGCYFKAKAADACYTRYWEDRSGA